MAALDQQADRKILVVTPSIGHKHVIQCAQSVLDQECYPNYHISHLVVWDGVHPIHIDGWADRYSNHYQMRLPWNVGSDGFYGHRVYAAIGHLINHDYVLFCDEDNFFDLNHVQNLVYSLEYHQKASFSFSHRKIVDKDGSFIAYDRFESTGKGPLFLVDTSSYCFRKNFLIEYGHQWHWGWGADRRFFQLVKDEVSYVRHPEATLNYRLDGNPGSPTKEFFWKGNMTEGFSKEGD